MPGPEGFVTGSAQYGREEGGLHCLLHSQTLKAVVLILFEIFETSL